MTPPPARDLLHPPNLTHGWAGLLVEALVRHGVDTFFVAPGARSTPLTTAVARHPTARAVVHFDERGTSFAALGYGRATGRPAAWVTTSGTAVANGLPAAMEAGADGVPLLLLTADRPPELRGTGANQTVDQVKLFGDVVRWFVDLPVPAATLPPAMVLTAAAQAVHHARRAPAGPVHLNCPFRKPLEPAPDGFDFAAYAADLAAWAAADAPYTGYPAPVPAPDDAGLDAVAHALAAARRGVVVCGRLEAPEAAAAARALARALGWPLLPDAASRLRFGLDSRATEDGATEDDIMEGEAAVCAPHYDALLGAGAFADAHRPDAAIHLGGTFVSKRLRLWLDAARPRPWVVARPSPQRLDPTHAVTHHVEAAVAPFCRRLAARLEGRHMEAEAGWRRRWTEASAAVARVLDAPDALGDADALTEPRTARLVTRHRPAGHALVLASSMPVRDADRYGDAAGAGGLVAANRGASGIDGTVATAAGVAHGTGRPVTLLIGDLALLHDLSSLHLLAGAPVVVVALNNDGGGIFHFLPIAAHTDVFEPFFGTPHGRTFEGAAAMFGLAYHRPTTPRAFADAYAAACTAAEQAGASALIEVATDRAANRALHAALDERVAEAVA